MYMYHNFMVHALLHCSEIGYDDLSLWYFAVKHLVWLYNRFLIEESGLTPL